MVITNAIAFNFLLCLFPLVLVLVAVSHQLPGRRFSAALILVLNEIIPFEREAMALSRCWGGQTRGFFRSRMLAVLMTVAGGLLALLSVAMTVAARAYGRE